jgi:hypothetical protein
MCWRSWTLLAGQRTWGALEEALIEDAPIRAVDHLPTLTAQDLRVARASATSSSRSKVQDLLVIDLAVA